MRQKEQTASWQKEERILLFITIGIIVLIWFILKGSGFWKPVLNALGRFFPKVLYLNSIGLIPALGMGYYTLQIIGYVLDCYWETVKPQKNVFKLFLFTAFFPQLVIGPISRYEQLKCLYEKHRFSYLNVTHGAQRILWGFFKKIVLGERVAIIVNGIWLNFTAYSGFYLWMALLLYPIQIYADFSGGMDIVLGTAETFGIRLAENFRNPFFSQTSQEIWQRWHITLGNWAKDYILYPVLKSKTLQKIGKFSKKKLGKKIGKFIPTAVGTFILWMMLGIWHGAPQYVIGVSLWYWMVLVLGELTEPLYAKIIRILGFHTENFSWKLFRAIRTYLIFAVGVVFGRASGTKNAIAFIKRIVGAFAKKSWNPWIFFDGSILRLGITYVDLNIIIFSLVLVLIVAILREKYDYARIWMDQQCLVFRWLVWIGLFVFVLIYGMYGPGYDAAEFIYERF